MARARIKKFSEIAKDRMAAFRKTLGEEADSPKDTVGVKHGHILACGHEDKNLFPDLRGDDGARKFFRDRRILWSTNGQSGDRGRRSGYEGPTRNLKSSQVSCVNFLMPLASVNGALIEFIQVINGDVVEIEPIVDENGRSTLVEFEWVGWRDSLEGKSMVRGAFNTSIDALIVGRNGHGRTAYLIEWKYSEENSRRAKSGKNRYKHYARAFTDSNSPFKGVAKLDDFFFDPYYQIMRMHLLGAKMLRSRVTSKIEVNRVCVIVVCPEANTEYRRVDPTLPLASRFSGITDMEQLIQASLRRPDEFRIIGQEHIMKHLRKTWRNSLTDWLDYHEKRYGW